MKRYPFLLGVTLKGESEWKVVKGIGEYTQRSYPLKSSVSSNRHNDLHAKCVMMIHFVSKLS